MCLCVYGGSHSPTRRPPVRMFRAARRDLAALAPLATGPHGWKEPGAVLARCLRGLHRYARRSGAAAAALVGLCPWPSPGCGSGDCPAAGPSARHGSPPTPAAARERAQGGAGLLRAAARAGPPQPWPEGGLTAPGSLPPPGAAAPQAGPLPGGGVLVAAVSPVAARRQGFGLARLRRP